MKLAPLAVLAMALPLVGQNDPPYHAGDPGVVPPSVTKKKEPTYTDDARNARIAGNVVLGAVIDETGSTKDIRVLSPLGWGLDENAIAAVQGWKFKPATKDGKPIPMRVSIHVSFGLEGVREDPNEENRTSTNVALTNLKSPEVERRARAVARLKELADKRYGPAAYIYSLVLRDGKETATNPQEANRYLEIGASQHYGPAEYELGRQYLSSGKLEQGRDLAIAGANHGSDLAQFFLGQVYMQGLFGFERSNQEARKYFSLCAARAKVECRADLGALLLYTPNRKNDDFEEAIA